MTETYRANGCEFIAEDDMIVWWEVREKQPFEPVTTDWMFKVMKQRGGTFVDVGASTGWFTIPMLARGYDVLSFEPNPNVVERLKANAALNGVDLQLTQAAASHEAGKTVFFHNPRVPLTSGGSIECATCRNPQRMEVPTITLDEAVSGPVSLMKIDVEGHEISVLDGAKRLITENRPHMMLEANTADHATEIRKWLGKIGGYTIAQADTRNLLCSPVS